MNIGGSWFFGRGRFERKTSPNKIGHDRNENGKQKKQGAAGSGFRIKPNAGEVAMPMRCGLILRCVTRNRVKVAVRSQDCQDIRIVRIGFWHRAFRRVGSMAAPCKDSTTPASCARLTRASTWPVQRACGCKSNFKGPPGGQAGQRPRRGQPFCSKAVSLNATAQNGTVKRRGPTRP